MEDLGKLISLIGETQNHFRQQAQRQVNTALTLRNWLFGFYIVEYEQQGADRAVYGDKLFREITIGLINLGFTQIRERHLYLCKAFYASYPNILRTASAKSYLADSQLNKNLRTASAKLIVDGNNGENEIFQTVTGISSVAIDKLINQLSFSHFLEFLKASNTTQRSFYELEALRNNWSVRELQRAMNSMLYERTGLSTNKEAVLAKAIKQKRLLPEDVFRNPYMLEFLGLREETEYTETELEQAIINHLHTFLLEMGRGFCFEARQKRITFDNTHYRIDLVFYHRILRCNVLIDLKLGEFTHADAGQMNVYLNYYKENETNEGDNPPVGIILCASKNENLVKYATAGLPQQVFVNKYLINLPQEDELRKIIAEEQAKINKEN